MVWRSNAWGKKLAENKTGDKASCTWENAESSILSIGIDNIHHVILNGRRHIEPHCWARSAQPEG
jgi:hypothetical protein